ncbi:hypothetical protein Halha_1780 [Halobacteroides halobius DSM 5150]|uniref:Uncharacterized protein n=1 Tax=Halobacteroides halobius (strain ATCC 35273 / DSM 5150 / MD-1) TaxID=748449 RepID=L0K9M4_HALHC|nr:hypothetical protein [Halobacteroides halobius]AGB41716.1 hypothetical protein Halha_1780 [Halobacteroides halobius DSM 5150]
MNLNINLRDKLLILGGSLLVTIISGSLIFFILDRSAKQNLTKFKRRISEIANKHQEYQYQELNQQEERQTPVQPNKIRLDNNLEGYSNPFKSILKAQKEKVTPKEIKDNKPIIKVLGIIKDAINKKVIIKFNSGKSYILQPGDKVNDLEICNIMDNRITVKRGKQYFFYQFGGANN